MTDRQFEALMKVLEKIAEDINWIASEGIPSGSLSSSSVITWLKNLDRIATALENADWAQGE